MTRRWGILLEGDETELRRWELAFSGPFDPYVSIEQRGHVLWCAELQAEKNSSEVWQATKTLMVQANSTVMHCQGPSNVKCAGILEVQQDGQHSVHAFAEVHINESIFFGATMSATVIDKNGNVIVQEPQETTAQKWMRIAATSDRLGDALIYGLKRESWFDLYKAYEAIELLHGGEHGLKSLNWVEPTSVTRFKRTANFYHRHARGKYEEPNDPMTLQDAKGLVATLLRRAFSEAE